VSILKSALKRYALICGVAAWTTAAVTQAAAQEPAPEAPAEHAPIPGAGGPGAARGNPRMARPRPTPSTPTPNNPHGARRAGPRVMPAADLAPGEIEVRLNSKDLKGIEDQEVTLLISKQSIERGNEDSTLTARTDSRGVARFTGQISESDHLYDVQAGIGAARYSTGQFQFKSAEAGMRIVLPIYESTNTLDGLLLLTRTLVAIVPQDNLFVVDVLLRVENYGEVAWLPENVVFPLPEGFKALNVRDAKGDARFEAEGDHGVKLTGTLAPGQHDLMFRFHLPTDGESERTFKFPTKLNTGMVRVILESSPTMKLEVPGFPAPDEARNNDGQRRLIAGRDFVTEKVRAPDEIEIKISGIPTPAAGRSVAVGLAAVFALVGLVQSIGKRRSTKAIRSDLSKEDRDQAGELLLQELINLEHAFAQGTIGRKTHEQAKRQLLEAFARLRAEDPVEEPA
jgi:hypothetical protein